MIRQKDSFPAKCSGIQRGFRTNRPYISTAFPPRFPITFIGRADFCRALTSFNLEQFDEFTSVRQRVGESARSSLLTRVMWDQSGADPIPAVIEKLQRGQLKEGCQWLKALRARFPESEKLRIRILEVIGPVTVKDIHSFDCRLASWLRSNVHEK